MFVVRARSFETFLAPELLPEEEVVPATYLRPAARHRFGWIDGVSLVPQRQAAHSSAPPPLSVVLRAESDDPWAADKHLLDLYTLAPDPEYPREGDQLAPPYLFPPVHQTSWASTRGHLRCRDILLGAHGTALWIQPRPTRHLDLTAYDVHSSDTQRPGQHSPLGAPPPRETLVAALLPGRLRDGGRGEALDEPDEVRTLWAFDGSNGTWTSVDYDEARGLVALGDSQGNVDILKL